MKCLKSICSGTLVFMPRDVHVAGCFPDHWECSLCGARYRWSDLNKRGIKVPDTAKVTGVQVEEEIDSIPDGKVLDSEKGGEEMSEMKTKLCRICGPKVGPKPISEYHKHTRAPDGLDYVCKACKSERAKEAWKNKKKEKDPVPKGDNGRRKPRGYKAEHARRKARAAGDGKDRKETLKIIKKTISPGPSTPRDTELMLKDFLREVEKKAAMKCIAILKRELGISAEV